MKTACYDGEGGNVFYFSLSMLLGNMNMCVYCKRYNGNHSNCVFINDACKRLSGLCIHAVLVPVSKHTCSLNEVATN